MDLETTAAAEKGVSIQSDINKKLALIEGYKILIKNFDSDGYLKKDFEQYAKWADGFNKYMRDQGYKGEDSIQKTSDGYKLMRTPEAILAGLKVQEHIALYGSIDLPTTKKSYLVGVSCKK